MCKSGFVTEAMTNTERNHLEEEGFILAHGWGGFSPWSAGSITSRAVARQIIMLESVWQSRDAHFLAVTKAKESSDRARAKADPSRAPPPPL